MASKRGERKKCNSSQLAGRLTGHQVTRQFSVEQWQHWSDWLTESLTIWLLAVSLAASVYGTFVFNPIECKQDTVERRRKIQTHARQMYRGEATATTMATLLAKQTHTDKDREDRRGNRWSLIGTKSEPWTCQTEGHCLLALRRCWWCWYSTWSPPGMVAGLG